MFKGVKRVQTQNFFVTLGIEAVFTLIYTLMKHRQFFIIVCLMILTSFSTTVVAQTSRIKPSNPADSLWSLLSRTRNADDSIKILYNLYDLMSSTKSAEIAAKENKWILTQLYDVANRQGNAQAIYDATRALAVESRYDVNTVGLQMRRLSDLPDNSARREVLSFLRLVSFMKALRDSTLTDEQRRENFFEIRKHIEKDKNNKTLYDRMDQQFALVLFGSNLINTEQLDKYLRDLRRYVETADDADDILKSYYFRTAAILYDEAQDGPKAIEADNELLKLLDKREQRIKASGRIFKNYDSQRFSIYRRMLSNYQHLSDDSVNIIYQRLQNLINKLPHGHITDLDKKTVNAMWNMHKKNYNRALPDLRHIMSSSRFNAKPAFILAYIEAASALNALSDLESGQQRYIDLLTEKARDAADTEYARMRIEYEIDTLEASTNSAHQFAKAADRETMNVTNRYMRYGAIALGVFLLAVLIIQIISNRRRRRVAVQLTAKNNELQHERDLLQATKNELERVNDKMREVARQKEEFLHNVSREISEPAKNIIGFAQLITDSIPEERRQYLTKFVDIINHNCDILKRIVSDILDSAEADHSITNITITHFSLESICILVAESFMPRLNENQKIEVLPLVVSGQAESDDMGVDTDARRLEQILVNVIANAVKFAPKGTIKIEPRIDFDSGMMTVAVTDPGPGIPPGKEEIIFNRFEKLGHFADGLGLGLFVSRQLVHALDGEIKVDTTHKHGARFVITLPINLSIDKNSEK